jgi:hypothetical protein
MQRQQDPIPQTEQMPEQRRQLYRRYRFSYIFTMACFGSMLGVAACVPFQWFHSYKTAPEGMEGVVVALAFIMEVACLYGAWWNWKMVRLAKSNLKAFLMRTNEELLGTYKQVKGTQ